MIENVGTFFCTETFFMTMLRILNYSYVKIPLHNLSIFFFHMFVPEQEEDLPGNRKEEPSKRDIKLFLGGNILNSGTKTTHCIHD